MSDAFVAALLAGMTALVTATATAIVFLLRSRSRYLLRRERQAITEYQQFADLQQKRIDGLIRQLKEYEQTIEDARTHYLTCERRIANLEAQLAIVTDHARRLTTACRRLGVDPDEMPVLEETQRDAPPEPNPPE